MRALAALLLLVSPGAFAQAAPTCPQHPQTVARMRNCYRPLLVFAPGTAAPALARQAHLLDDDADDMMDRFVMLVPVTEDVEHFAPPLDAPYAVLPPAELARLRKQFRVPTASFRVILLGEDGSPKLEAAEPVAPEKLNAIIDSMPTRQAEEQRPHSN